MPRKKRIKYPIDIPLQKNVLLENGCLVVDLPTLEELESFWAENREKFPYAAVGRYTDDPWYLDEYEWVLGPSREAVVETVMRWTEFGIQCAWKPFEGSSAWIKEAVLGDRETERSEMMAEGTWTDEREQKYLADCARRNEDTYNGLWELAKLPGDCNYLDWISSQASDEFEELFDPNIPISDVETYFKRYTFEDWRGADAEVEFMNVNDVDKFIKYWIGARANGEGYYGNYEDE